jgi:hypothetical protein
VEMRRASGACTGSSRGRSGAGRGLHGSSPSPDVPHPRPGTAWYAPREADGRECSHSLARTLIPESLVAQAPLPTLNPGPMPRGAPPPATCPLSCSVLSPVMPQLRSAPTWPRCAWSSRQGVTGGRERLGLASP